MRLRHIFIGILATVIALSGCDEIANPHPSQQQNSTLPITPPTYRDSSATSGTYSYTQYKLLLEDCMGDQCSNCPTAAAIADTLVSTYSNPTIAGNIVMMEENMGFDAQPVSSDGSSPPGVFETNYTCAAGTQWCKQFGLYYAPYPVGMINRLGYTSSNPSGVNILYTNWVDSVNTILRATPQSVAINIHDSCWVPQRIIGVEFQVTFLKSLPPGSYSLEALIIEDSIISWQADGNTFDSAFVHRNVLRGAFGNNSGGLPNGVTITNTAPLSTWISYQTYDFTKGENGRAATWNMARCHIVAFVFNSQTYQVIQAEEIRVE